MINDIRFQASQLLQLQDNTPVLNGNFNKAQSYGNAFEDLLQGDNNKIEEQNSNTSLILVIIKHLIPQVFKQ